MFRDALLFDEWQRAIPQYRSEATQSPRSGSAGPIAAGKAAGHDQSRPGRIVGSCAAAGQPPMRVLARIVDACDASQTRRLR